MAATRRAGAALRPTRPSESGTTRAIPNPITAKPICASSGVVAANAPNAPSADARQASAIRRDSATNRVRTCPPNRPIPIVRPSNAGPAAPCVASPPRSRSMSNADHPSTATSAKNATRTTTPPSQTTAPTEEDGASDEGGAPATEPTMNTAATAMHSAIVVKTATGPTPSCRAMPVASAAPA